MVLEEGEKVKSMRKIIMLIFNCQYKNMLGCDMNKGILINMMS